MTNPIRKKRKCSARGRPEKSTPDGAGRRGGEEFGKSTQVENAFQLDSHMTPQHLT